MSIRFLMISTGFSKYQSGFVSNGTEYLKCYSFHTERNYSFSYKFLFGRIIRIPLKPRVETLDFGPSGAVQTVSSKRAVGHYFWYFSFLVLLVLVTTVAKLA